MSVKIQVIGADKAAKYLKDKSKDTESNIDKALKLIGLFVQGEVKQSIAGRRAEKTSVDTGRFLNSVDFQVANDDVVIFSKLDYSKYLEYGTTRIAPRKHFRNSRDRNMPKVKQIMNNEIKKL